MGIDRSTPHGIHQDVTTSARRLKSTTKPVADHTRLWRIQDDRYHEAPIANTYQLAASNLPSYNALHSDHEMRGHYVSINVVNMSTLYDWQRSNRLTNPNYKSDRVQFVVRSFILWTFIQWAKQIWRHRWMQCAFSENVPINTTRPIDSDTYVLWVCHSTIRDQS